MTQEWSPPGVNGCACCLNLKEVQCVALLLAARMEETAVPAKFRFCGLHTPAIIIIINIDLIEIRLVLCSRSRHSSHVFFAGRRWRRRVHGGISAVPLHGQNYGRAPCIISIPLSTRCHAGREGFGKESSSRYIIIHKVNNNDIDRRA